MILEELMLELMYHLPSQKRVKEFEVTKEMVENRDVSIANLRRKAKDNERTTEKSDPDQGKIRDTQSTDDAHRDV